MSPLWQASQAGLSGTSSRPRPWGDGNQRSRAEDDPPGRAVAQEVAQRLREEDADVDRDLGEGAEEAPRLGRATSLMYSGTMTVEAPAPTPFRMRPRPMTGTDVASVSRIDPTKYTAAVASIAVQRPR